MGENAPSHVEFILLKVNGKTSKPMTIRKSIILYIPKTLRKDNLRERAASCESIIANHRDPFRNLDTDNIFVAGKGFGFDFGDAFGNDDFVPVDVFAVGGEHRM